MGVVVFAKVTLKKGQYYASVIFAWSLTDSTYERAPFKIQQRKAKKTKRAAYAQKTDKSCVKYIVSIRSGGAPVCHIKL